ncbi:glycosyltransferase involved in cell wall biosynthesis [Halanaerobium saccharolyticum]|uniref:Glycosyltransferase involved in cell wall biosynthesis n=1 Tax=Halanaerobium saccharolyticum TaxID=43595 RepID=A0A4R6R8T3_9FIRM|nr:glycosyltransferase family 4 protein [Halanaerobium saccharolyticum]TDP82304.1 glycosyltransferase involved in cell wall biosynthesis [Halanaerobium saccharolyticum]
MKKENDVLILDLNSTTPVYTAYFSDALNKVGFNSKIFGKKRVYETKHLDYLDFDYIENIFCISNKIKNNTLKKILEIVEYFINWLNVLFLSKKYKIIHIQWLPLTKYFVLWDYLMVFLLLKINNNVYYTVHNVIPHNNKSKRIRNNYKKLYKLLPNLVVHTQSTKEKLNKDFNINENKILVSAHGPIYHQLKNDSISRKEKTVGIIGNISKYKRIEDSIKAIKSLHNEGIDVNLIIAGSGPNKYVKKLNKLIKTTDLNSSVKIINRYLDIQEMLEWYQEIRGLLVTYEEIEMSGAVMTALPLGTPVIAYDVGGLNEVIENNYNGRLVKKGDIKGIANSIKWILDKDESELSLNCKKSIEKFSWRDIAKSLKETYLANI